MLLCCTQVAGCGSGRCAQGESPRHFLRLAPETTATPSPQEIVAGDSNAYEVLPMTGDRPLTVVGIKPAGPLTTIGPTTHTVWIGKGGRTTLTAVDQTGIRYAGVIKVRC